MFSVCNPMHLTCCMLKNGSCKNRRVLDLTDITDTAHRLRPKIHDVSENASASSEVNGRGATCYGVTLISKEPNTLVSFLLLLIFF